MPIEIILDEEQSSFLAAFEKVIALNDIEQLSHFFYTCNKQELKKNIPILLQYSFECLDRKIQFFLSQLYRKFINNIDSTELLYYELLNPKQNKFQQLEIRKLLNDGISPSELMHHLTKNIHGLEIFKELKEKKIRTILQLEMTASLQNWSFFSNTLERKDTSFSLEIITVLEKILFECDFITQPYFPYLLIFFDWQEKVKKTNDYRLSNKIHEVILKLIGREGYQCLMEIDSAEYNEVIKRLFPFQTNIILAVCIIIKSKQIENTDYQQLLALIAFELAEEQHLQDYLFVLLRYVKLNPTYRKNYSYIGKLIIEIISKLRIKNPLLSQEMYSFHSLFEKNYPNNICLSTIFYISAHLLYLPHCAKNNDFGDLLLLLVRKLDSLYENSSITVIEIQSQIASTLEHFFIRELDIAIKQSYFLFIQEIINRFINCLLYFQMYKESFYIINTLIEESNKEPNLFDTDPFVILALLKLRIKILMTLIVKDSKSPVSFEMLGKARLALRFKIENFIKSHLQKEELSRKLFLKHLLPYINLSYNPIIYLIFKKINILNSQVTESNINPFSEILRLIDFFVTDRALPPNEKLKHLNQWLLFLTNFLKELSKLEDKKHDILFKIYYMTELELILKQHIKNFSSLAFIVGTKIFNQVRTADSIRTLINIELEQRFLTSIYYQKNPQQNEFSELLQKIIPIEFFLLTHDIMDSLIENQILLRAKLADLKHALETHATALVLALQKRIKEIAKKLYYAGFHKETLELLTFMTICDPTQDIKDIKEQLLLIGYSHSLVNNSTQAWQAFNSLFNLVFKNELNDLRMSLACNALDNAKRIVTSLSLLSRGTLANLFSLAELFLNDQLNDTFTIKINNAYFYWLENFLPDNFLIIEDFLIAMRLILEIYEKFLLHIHQKNKSKSIPIAVLTSIYHFIDLLAFKIASILNPNKQALLNEVVHSQHLPLIYQNEVIYRKFIMYSNHEQQTAQINNLTSIFQIYLADNQPNLLTKLNNLQSTVRDTSFGYLYDTCIDCLKKIVLLLEVQKKSFHTELNDLLDILYMEIKYFTSLSFINMVNKKMFILSVKNSLASITQQLKLSANEPLPLLKVIDLNAHLDRVLTYNSIGNEACSLNMTEDNQLIRYQFNKKLLM